MGLIFSEGLSFSGFERDRVFLNRPGAAFLDLSDVSGADSDNDGRAACVADFDDDGDPDLFVTNIQRSRHLLYRNDLGDASGNRFLKLRLRGTSGHHQAIGATVRVRAGGAVQAQVKSAGSGFVSQHAEELIFGLGRRQEAEVEVRWPGGALERFGKLAPGRYRLVEGTGRPEPRAPRTFAFRDPPPRGLKIRVGDRLPPLLLEDAAGRKVSLKLEEGSTQVVNFWASYCASCLKEMPELEKLHRRPGYRVVAVNLDPPEERPRAALIIDRAATTFPCFYEGGSGLEAVVDLDRLSLPTSLWFAADGTLEKVTGALPPGD